MWSRLFNGFFFLVLLLLLCSLSIALDKDDASEALLSDNPKSETWQSPELLNLAKEFRRWRRSFQDGIPEYVRTLEEQLKGLKEFRRRLDSIDPSSWPIPAKVDYLVVLIDMNSLEFDLKIIRQVSRNPDFYSMQAIRRMTQHNRRPSPKGQGHNCSL